MLCLYCCCDILGFGVIGAVTYFFVICLLLMLEHPSALFVFTVYASPDLFLFSDVFAPRTQILTHHRNFSIRFNQDVKHLSHIH